MSVSKCHWCGYEFTKYEIGTVHDVISRGNIYMAKPPICHAVVGVTKADLTLKNYEELLERLTALEEVVFKQKKIDELKQQLADLEGTPTVGFKGK